MRISELAKKAGCTVESIRFYENHDLIPRPPRTDSNYRIYGPAHLARLLFIRHCRSLDLSLSEIKTLADVVESTQRKIKRAAVTDKKQASEVSRSVDTVDRKSVV